MIKIKSTHFLASLPVIIFGFCAHASDPSQLVPDRLIAFQLMMDTYNLKGESRDIGSVYLHANAPNTRRFKDGEICMELGELVARSQAVFGNSQLQYSAMKGKNYLESYEKSDLFKDSKALEDIALQLGSFCNNLTIPKAVKRGDRKELKQRLTEVAPAVDKIVADLTTLDKNSIQKPAIAQNNTDVTKTAAEATESKTSVTQSQSPKVHGAD